MSIYNDGIIYPWEILIALVLGGVLLWFGMRTSRRADRRFQQREADRVKAERQPADPASAPSEPSE